MKIYRNCVSSAMALVALAPLLHAQKETKLRHVEGDLASPGRPFEQQSIEKEKVAFLGVETAPAGRALSTQLGLPRDTGLVVTHVLENSPASGVLKEDDVLTKLDDQLLINMPQLGVLVRSRKEGDEVKLTVIRAGKEITVKAKLAVREMPKMAFFMDGVGRGGFDRLRELPGVGPDGARDVMRMIARERGNFVTGPRVHVMGRAGRGATVVDLPQSNVFYSDDDGSIEIKIENGKRNLTVKNPKGEVAFTGAIDTPEDRTKLAPEVRQRLEKIETDTMKFEERADFEPEVIPFPPEAGATKIKRDLNTGYVRFHDSESESF